MLPSSSDLRYFLEVSNSLNISRAAERLGISQPSLSLSIKRIEGELGVPLLIRNKTGVTLTRAGKKFSLKARDLLQEWETIYTETSKAEEEITGNYSLGCHPSVALFSLPSIIPKLLAQNQTLNLTLIHGSSREITADVINLEIDFGIVVNPVQHPDLVIQTLCKDEVTLWVGKGKSKLQDPNSGEAVLLCNPDLVQTQSIRKQFQKSKLAFSRTITSSSLELLCSLVSVGAGVGIIPGRVAERVRSLGLKPLSGASPIFHDTISLIYRSDSQSSQASRNLSRQIRNLFMADIS